MFDTFEQFLKYCENDEDRRKAHEIQKEADGICRMVLDEQCPAVDIEIAKDNLRRKAEQIFPDKMVFYDMIYEARFRRLWEQFRQGTA